MIRRTSNLLILEDSELECKKKDVKIDDIEIGSFGFKLGDMSKYDTIVYKGRLGKKLLLLRN